MWPFDYRMEIKKKSFAFNTKAFDIFTLTNIYGVDDCFVHTNGRALLTRAFVFHMASGAVFA